MPYLHLGEVALSSLDLMEDDGVTMDGGGTDVSPVLYAPGGVEVHTLPSGDGVQMLPDLIVNAAPAQPVNWLAIAALVAGLWALSQGGGTSKEWD